MDRTVFSLVLMPETCGQLMQDTSYAGKVRIRRALLVLLIVSLGLIATSRGTASADLLSPQVLDGPSASILDVDGTAMAADGSGGVVYRKLLNGVPHVFASQYVNGSWRAPVQVDTGQKGPATMPAIAAADGGELLVVWVQPWEGQVVNGQVTEVYRLMSAVLQPGAKRFSVAEPIDSVGDGTAAYPSLSMNAGGTAYVTYRVVTNSLLNLTAGLPTPMRPGDELVNVDVAKFNGLWWSTLGSVNEYPGQVTMRKPTASNAPQIAVGQGGNDSGNAVVVWQEPDATGYARIWARRIYSSTLGPAIQISPNNINGKPVDVDADAPTVSFSQSAEAAFRLSGGTGSPIGQSELMALSVPTAAGDPDTDTYTDLASSSTPGPPSVATNTGGALTALVSGGQASVGVIGSQLFGLGQATAATQAFVSPDPGGGQVVAWQGTDGNGLPIVRLADTFPDGTAQAGTLSAPLSGPISGLSMGASGYGDALVGWMQGPTDRQQVVGAAAQAPPQPFTLTTPTDWVSPADAKLTWEPAPDAYSSLTYEVVLSGHVVATGIQGPSAIAPYLTAKAGTATSAPVDGEANTISYNLPSSALTDGKYQAEVIAVDQLGQQTASGYETIKVDTQPPSVNVSLQDHQREVKVTVSDSASGVDSSDTKISFGDHTKAVKKHDTVTHGFKQPGRYLVTVDARDNAGNKRVAQVRVNAR